MAERSLEDFLAALKQDAAEAEEDEKILLAPLASPPDLAPAVDGAQRPAGTPDAKPRPRFCRQCGTQLQANWRFCGRCGSPIQ